MKVLRVFASRTSYTPKDSYAKIGLPEGDYFIPQHDEVHISCSFSWDREHALFLQKQWQERTSKPVLVGGPAFMDEAHDFKQGLYIAPNVVFTTRGCNNNCPWCIVPKIEGKLKEIPITQGNWIQDNNFLQSSRKHKDAVFEMLKSQKQICFKGGLEVDLIDDHFVGAIAGLRISELWLACDTDARLPKFKKACERLTRAGLNRNKIRCYALIGDDMDKNEARLREIYHAGAMPFAQLFRDFTETKTAYSSDWNGFERMWQRPAATRAHMEKGTSARDFNQPKQIEGQEEMDI